ncbi:hypothetical protein [Aureimonas altamirensis]|uniref:hypothetical protein n=1 Tax=Aureimonas altamirensis TaxID=370622 RepID=UPI002556168D|nr:hypothetical protein [Aureimonas altamirensis]
MNIWPFGRSLHVDTGTQTEIDKERGKLAAQIEDVKRGTVRLQIVEEALALKERY